MDSMNNGVFRQHFQPPRSRVSWCLGRAAGVVTKNE